MRAWKVEDRPIVLAHRGGANEVPENSRLAFQVMVERGHTYIETDVHPSSDGQLVIIHDPVLDRTLDGSGFVSAHTWDELAQMKDKSGEPPMRLEEALEEFPEATLNVDIKTNEGVAPAVKLLRDGAYDDRVLLASFNESRLSKLRRALPNIRTSLGISAIARLLLASKLPEGRRKRGLLRLVPGPGQGADCAQVPLMFKRIGVIDPAFIETANSIGLQVHAWTINEVKDMSALLDMGIQGLITDEPTRAKELIDARFPRDNAPAR